MSETSEESPVRNDPFNRPKVDAKVFNWSQDTENRCRNLLEKFGNPVDQHVAKEELFKTALKVFHAEWRLRKKNSEIAFKGLLMILELCLALPLQQSAVFALLIETLGYNTLTFWKSSVPHVYNSDLSYSTQYRDALLFSLLLYDVNNCKCKLRELYAAVPGIRKSLLGTQAKMFGEKFRHILMVRSRANSRMSSVQGSTEDLLSLDNDAVSDEHSSDVASNTHHSSVPSSLCDLAHHKQRVINVSNAPPVTINRRNSGFEITQGSGGLVACVDPVMSGDRENIWLSNIGYNFLDDKKEDILPATNSLGLPLIKQARAGAVFHVLEEDDKRTQLTPNQQIVEKDMSLLSVLNDYNKKSYQLTPVVLTKEEYSTYYEGISNGLLWPALHNLPQHIVSDYDDLEKLRADWCSYVRVNYQFAINAARNSRAQDFIWIHDYHLMLCGQIMRSLESSLEVGFFLHIPFQPPKDFMTKYKIAADPIIRALLRFTKVGFQTSRDRESYVNLVRETIPKARIQYDTRLDRYTIAHDGWTCSLGVFPVSIKIEDFLNVANDPQVRLDAETIRKTIMKPSGPSGRFFFSVERFDYTKGIDEKLRAWRQFLEKHPDRIGKDVLYQVAVTNRRGVESYRKYQDDCLKLAEEINATIKSEEYPDWKPLIFQTDGLPRNKLIAHYLAMDVGVVTPSKDGMNLVAKEMLVCNPVASLVLSTGAGTEVQLGSAGFYSDTDRCYHRVEDISNTDKFAETFYTASIESFESREENGRRLNNFLKEHDIEEWSTAFLDPNWTHEVISQSDVTQLADFYILMDNTARVRRQIVEVVLKGLPIRPHFTHSLENTKNALENSCEEGTKKLVLATTNSAEDADGNNLEAKFDITDELNELQKDIAFLSFIQSGEYTNVEQFVATLGSFHQKGGPAKFSAELESALQLLLQGEHFHYFFTDRDGTLKSYACSYPTSIQPAYSAVIQAQFARRCAQFCAIVTTAPLVHIGILDVATIPEGYYAFGASAGREWYLNPAQQFKDDTVSESDLQLLNSAFDKIEDLLETVEYRNFTWIGSGLQKHYGHITIAKQDVNNSVPKRKMIQLYEQITKIVNDVDPAGIVLTIRESDLDIKIYTKAKLSGRIFDKGHGVRLAERKMGIKLHEGNILVCGDSESDIPMLQECLSVARTRVYTIWVTTDETLQEKVTSLCATYSNTNVRFVSCPQVLLGAMAAATVKELTRGSNNSDMSFRLDQD